MATRERERTMLKVLEAEPFATKDDVRQALYDAEPEVSKGGIRGWLNRQYAEGEAPWDKSKTCPKCGLEANGNAEIVDKFGLRYQGKVAQSYCKGCR